MILGDADLIVAVGCQVPVNALRASPYRVLASYRIVMETIVMNVFSEIMSDVVNLQKSRMDDAYANRYWLYEKLNGF